MADFEGSEFEDVLTEVFRDGYEDFRDFVNPLIAQRAQLVGEPIDLRSTRDGALVDAKGDVVEDFHGTMSLGHRNPEIAAFLKEYLSSDVPNWYPSRVNPFVGRLGRLLCERTGYNNTSFATTGTGAVEAAMKLARALTGRPRILGQSGAYHGCTFGSVSLMDPGLFKDAFGPHLPGAEVLPFGDVDALHRAFKEGDVAALVVEPIQVEGGVRALPDDFIEAACALTKEHGALLVADEVQTGVGRTGRGFLASQDWPRQPDAVLMAKHLGGGLMPLSTMLTRREIFMDAYGKDFASGESHNTTWAFNALSCVVAFKALEMVDDALIERVQTVGTRFRKKLEEALLPSPLVREIRGEGLLFGIVLEELDHPWLSFEHLGLERLSGQTLSAPLLCHRLFKRGFFCYTSGHDWRVCRVLPRFDIPEETLDRFVEAAAEEVDYLASLN
jgi:acetylornithine/succinyldiaminopimelate/putrescine aminotransferase